MANGANPASRDNRDPFAMFPALDRNRRVCCGTLSPESLVLIGKIVGVAGILYSAGAAVYSVAIGDYKNLPLFIVLPTSSLLLLRAAYKWEHDRTRIPQ